MFEMSYIYIVISITIFLLHSSKHKYYSFSAAISAAEVTITIVKQTLKCEIIVWLGILYYLPLVTRLTNTISRTTMESRTVI